MDKILFREIATFPRVSATTYETVELINFVLVVYSNKVFFH